MPNNYLSVLYKHIIQVENKNVGLKVGGTNIPLPPIKKVVSPAPPASDYYYYYSKSYKRILYYTMFNLLCNTLNFVR